jgi:serine phosphatase RsbU (regulator of sigma subunit)
MSAPDGTNLPEERSMSVEEENKALVRRLIEANAKADLDTLDKLLAPDFVDHSPLPGHEPGREGFKQQIAEEYAIFSNIRINIEDQVAAEGDKVITRLSRKRIHDRGEYLGVAPTGMEYPSRSIVIHRIEGGKIVEEWSEGTSVAEAMRQRLERERIERERIDQELRVARRIQQASLPRTVPTLGGWEIAHHYQPAREVGGDFFDFHLLSDDRVGFLVGDTTGKGVPAALVMSTTCGMLRAVSLALGSSSPSEVLKRVNEALCPNIAANMFVTCFYAILEPESGHLVYANAGHDLPYLWHGGNAEELRARGMPLGLMPGMTYEEKEVVLERDDSALFYSDGLVEAHDPKEEMFGFPRLQALVAKYGAEGSLGKALPEELYTFVGEGWEQEDDITLLTLRRSAARS